MRNLLLMINVEEWLSQFAWLNRCSSVEEFDATGVSYIPSIGFMIKTIQTNQALFSSSVNRLASSLIAS